MERMGERLAARMKSQFVGRADELILVESLLRAGDQGAVVFVHGPGGVGKTTLLRRFAVLADDVGRHVVRVDGRDVPPIPAAFVAAVATAAGVGTVGDTAGIADAERGAVESTNDSAAGPDPVQALGSSRASSSSSTRPSCSARWTAGCGRICCPPLLPTPSRSLPGGSHRVSSGAPTRAGVA